MTEYDVIKYVRGCGQDLEKAIRLARNIIQERLRANGDIKKITSATPITPNLYLIHLKIETPLPPPALANLLKGTAWIELPASPEKCVERQANTPIVEAKRNKQ